MRKLLWIVPVALLSASGEVAAEVITFDTPQISSLFTHTYNALQGPLLYSDSYSEFDLGDVTLTAEGQTSGGFPSMFYFRNTFDNRTPYPYQSISDNVAQIYSTQLWLDFDISISSFGFGAALDSTVSPSTMQVEWFLDGALVGNGVLDLRRSPGGSNSEGSFAITGIEADSVRLTNAGDGVIPASNYNWVIDNVTYTTTPAPVPEPSSFILASSGLAGFGLRRWRRRVVRRI
jgi:hypothetical protein